MTKNSAKELTPSVEHLAAPTFMAPDGKSMQKTDERTPLDENAPPVEALPGQTRHEQPLSQPIGASQPLPHPGSFKAPEGMSYLGLDRTFKANLARLTHGITPAGRARLF
jgi:hypothetical protein